MPFCMRLRSLGKRPTVCRQNFDRQTLDPWGEIIGTRNRIIHGYDRIEFDIIWDIATDKAKLLLEHLEPLLPKPPESTT